jgi:hypothetical protein
VKRTLREWKKLWESWDINDDAELEKQFTDAQIEDEEWEMPCEIDLILTTVKGNIGLAEVRIVDDEEGAILVKYEYDVPYEMGRPELIDLIESINDDAEDDDENEDEEEDEDEDEVEEVEEVEPENDATI